MQSVSPEPQRQPDYAVYYTAVNGLGEDTYAMTARLYGRILRSVLDKLSRNADLLDVGCGAGFLVSALRGEGFTNISGVDACATLIDAAQSRGLPCKVVAEDYVEREAPSQAGRYQAIFLLDVLEHIPKGRQLGFLSGLRTMIRRDGVLVLSVPNASSSLASRWRYNDWTHTSAFTEHSLAFVLTAAGFEGIRFLPHEFMHRPRYPLLVRPSVLHWMLHRVFRAVRRLQVVAELGPQGWTVPLALNLLAVSTPSDATPPERVCKPTG
jgi:2-polyprenyl-3-methyl-5-hydroxy-6-metoxy-1,4-benzoquinol methylase